MIKGLGIDIVEVERIQTAVEKYADKFLNRIYTKEEIEYSESFKNKKYVHLAARFAVKEAFSKAIGTGITQGFKFNEICTINEESGEPKIILDGNMKEKYGDYSFLVSISHTDSTAVAVVIMEEK
ncbi:MAG: holo-ACP synthase [Candidatus Kapaibacteriota bacterium]